MTRRIERDPEPWQYSESNFQHVAESLVRADTKQQRKEASQATWRAFWGGVIGTSVALLCWYGIIWTVLYVCNLTHK